MGQILQGIPVAKAIGALPPEVQRVASNLGHAQIRYETAVAGMRAGSSPQMYDRFRKIVGNLEDPSTPAALRALANDMQQGLLLEQKDAAGMGFQVPAITLRPEVDPNAKKPDAKKGTVAPSGQQGGSTQQGATQMRLPDGTIVTRQPDGTYR